MKNMLPVLLIVVSTSSFATSKPDRSHQEYGQLLMDYFNEITTTTNSPSIDVGEMHDNLYSYCLTGWMIEPEVGALSEILKRAPDPRYNSYLMGCIENNICDEGSLLEALSGSVTQTEVNALSVVLVNRLSAFKDLDSPGTGPLWNVLFNARLNGELDLDGLEKNMRSTFTNPDKLKIVSDIQAALLHLEQIEAEEKSNIGKPYFSDVEEGEFKKWLLSLRKEHGGKDEIYNPTPDQLKTTLRFEFFVFLQNNGLYPESIMMINQMKDRASQEPAVKTPVELSDVQGSAAEL